MVTRRPRWFAQCEGATRYSHSMAFTPKPCPQCGGVSFQVLPGIQVELWQATTVLGLAAASKLGGWLTVTLVVCTQCTRTETYSTNAADLMHRVPGSYVLTAR